MSHVLPPFPSPDLGSLPLPERISLDDIKKLQTLYRDHCEVTLPLRLHVEDHFSCYTSDPRASIIGPRHPGGGAMFDDPPPSRVEQEMATTSY